MGHIRESQRLFPVARLIYLHLTDKKKFNCFIKAISFIST